jgi:hypothetical protein
MREGGGLMRRLLGIVIVATALTAACGGKGNPTAPSGNSGGSGSPAAPAPAPAAGTSATITGSVQGSSAASSLVSASAGAALTGVTVAVVGTNLTSSVDAVGRFTLLNVPAGEVRLQLTGAGTNATVALGAVEASQTVDVVVMLSGASASIESAVRSGASEAQLEGRIESLPPSMAPLTFKAAGRTVKTDATTRFTDGSVTRAFGDLQLGMRVHVKGSLAGDAFNATRVELQQAATPPGKTPEEGQNTSASIHGVLKSIGGAKPGLVLMVDATTVRTSSGTEVKRRGDVQTLDELKTGQSLHVVGDRQADGSIDARKIEITDDPAGGPFEIAGSVGGLKGTCPAVSFGVNGFSVTTSSATVFEGAACSALKSGGKVTVKGLKQADGSVAATSVRTM